tara:strand:+ start:12712 stop:13377 length:666 start_codon:yes stop_codon:yes gene_type:complete
MLSHGFLKQVININKINEIFLKVKKHFEKEISNSETYFDGIHLLFPESLDLIDNKIDKLIKNLLGTNNVNLENVELHILNPKKSSIPPHQDNFYHCINPQDGLKILIPFDELNNSSGSLNFYDCENNYPTLKHEASKTKNFSAYIPDIVIRKLNLTTTCYTYNKGDASYHFLSSIHFSKGNISKKSKYFIVFRFQKAEAIVKKNEVIKYENTRKEHLKIIN